jgi:mRNA interferase MazF
MSWQRGDVVVVDFPFVDRFGSKNRPALIVSSSTYHAERPQDSIVAVISTQIQRYNGGTDYLIQDWQAAGLSQPSVLRSTLLTILAARINRKIGTLTSRDLQEFAIRLKRALEL